MIDIKQEHIERVMGFLNTGQVTGYTGEAEEITRKLRVDGFLDIDIASIALMLLRKHIRGAVEFVELSEGTASKRVKK